MSEQERGRLIVFSGPSGVGKSTLLRSLMRRFPDRITLSVSATTRPPRPGERDGVDYHFLSPEQFASQRKMGQFLECCQVFGRDYWYGTPAEPVRASLQQGKWVVLDIDVQGARSVVSHYPDALTIFVRPRSLEQLEERLRSRGTESQAAIERRLAAARRELAESGWYRYHVINDTVDEAVSEISQILAGSGEPSA